MFKVVLFIVGLAISIFGFKFMLASIGIELSDLSLAFYAGLFGWYIGVSLIGDAIFGKE